MKIARVSSSLFNSWEEKIVFNLCHVQLFPRAKNVSAESDCDPLLCTLQAWRLSECYWTWFHDLPPLYSIDLITVMALSEGPLLVLLHVLPEICTITKQLHHYMDTVKDSYKSRFLQQHKSSKGENVIKGRKFKEDIYKLKWVVECWLIYVTPYYMRSFLLPKRLW